MRSSHQKHLFSATKSKYLKFKNRLERSISSGRFETLPRKKKNNLIARVEKLRLRLDNLGIGRQAAIAGSIAAGVSIPSITSAQNPDYRRSANSLPIATDAKNVVIANVDVDPEMEIIVSTASGGYIVNGNDADGFTASNPTNLSELTGAFEVGDVDGDGSLDIVYHDGLAFDASLNDGLGNFGAASPLVLNSSAISDWQLTDLDSDLDLDIAFAQSAYDLNYALNDGSGSFSAVSYINTGSKTLESFEVADLDGDGDMDLVAATFQDPGVYDYGMASVFENTTDGVGLPNFGAGYYPAVDEEGGGINFKYYHVDHIEVIDFDNDGDLDFFFNRAGYSDIYFAENSYDVDGTLSFDLISIPSVGNSVNAITKIDFDNDGNEDVLVSNGGETALFESDGSAFTKKNLNGTYGNVSGNFLDVAVGEIDGDGRDDIIGVNSVTNYVYLDLVGVYHLKIATNEFSERKTTANAEIGRLIGLDVDGNEISDVVFTLITGDGTNDVDNDRFAITGSTTPILEVGSTDLDWESQQTYRIYINAQILGEDRPFEVVLSLGNSPEVGWGTFEVGPNEDNVSLIEKGFSVDFDGDGLNELIIHDYGDRVYLLDETNPPEYIRRGEIREVVDFDGDGDLDIIISNNDDIYIHLSSVIGVANVYSHSVVGTSIRDVASGDFNNDGLSDLAIAAGSGGEVHLNDGDQTFSFFEEPQTTANDFAEVGDIDGDGFDDVIFGRSGATYIYTNELTYFQSVGSYSYYNGTDLKLADFDNDGDLDIVKTSNYGLITYDGDGTGSFSAIYDYTPYVYGAVFGDLDGDSDIDAIYHFVDYNGGEETNLIVALNDGSNNFVENQKLKIGDGRFFGLILGDFDGDDDLDVISSIQNDFRYHTNQNIAPLITGFSGRAIIDENTQSGTDLGQLSVTDYNGDAVTTFAFADGDNDNDLFTLDGSGNLTLNSDLDWEELGSDLSIDIELEDDQGNTRIETESLKVNNLAELGEGTFEIEGIPLFGTTVALTIEPGDYDMDGDADLLRSSFAYYAGPRGPREEEEIFADSQYGNSILQQNSGTFSEQPMYSGNNSKYLNVLFVDYDNDGDLDVLGDAQYGPTSSLVIATNDNNRFQSERTIGFTGKYANIVKLIEGDFDGDGLVDVAVHYQRFSGKYDDIEGVAIYEIDEGGEFSYSQGLEMYIEGGEIGLLEAVGDVENVAVGDFDNDGFDDLFVATSGDDVIFYGGEFGVSETYSIANTEPDYGFNLVNTGDIDGDGLTDFALLRESSTQEDMELDIHINNGAGFDLDQTINLGGEYSGDFQLGDVNGDGTLDIISSVQTSGGEEDGTSELKIHLNDGAGAFSLSQTNSDIGGEDLEIKLMDVDGDDDLDIVTHSLENKYSDIPSVLVFHNTNVPPSAINLSATAFDEHSPIDTEVATLSVDELNPLDTHIYSLVTGDGSNDEHNGYFTISGTSLRVVRDVAFEDTPQLNIYISVFDGHQTFEQAIVVDVNDVNQAPTGINLSATAFDERTAPGTSIATLSGVDANAGDTHTFEFATGDGTNDADNGSFAIDGDQLIITENSRFEDQASYNIYLAASDIDGTVEQAFVITVNDVNQAPTGINLSATAFEEGTAPGTSIATLTAVDANAGDTHTFELVTGDGSNDADNGSFTIDGDQLIVTVNSNFEDQASYNILIAATDIDGSVEQAFTINVNDENQAPTAIDLSNSAFEEGTDPGTTIATIGVTDPNAGDSHTLSLAVGDGSNDANNGSFVIDGNELILIDDINFDNTPTLNILISADDGEQSFEQAFTLTVNDALGIEDEVANRLGIYPNPGNDRLEINLENELTGHLTVKISDLTGKTVKAFESKKTSHAWTHRIDMTGVHPGIYLIDVMIGEKQFIQRWIKE